MVVKQIIISSILPRFHSSVQNDCALLRVHYFLTWHFLNLLVTDLHRQVIICLFNACKRTKPGEIAAVAQDGHADEGVYMHCVNKQLTCDFKTSNNILQAKSLHGCKSDVVLICETCQAKQEQRFFVFFFPSLALRCDSFVTSCVILHFCSYS